MNRKQDEVEELIEELCVDLNTIERRTWLKLIEGLSIRDIAKEEGVSRAAIYERIRGNSHGQGGMVGKNLYVARWWRLRNGKENS